MLATEGYFEPKLSFAADGDVLTLRVEPGPRTLVRQVNIEIAGDVDPERRQALLDSWPLQKGMPFRQAEWSRAKQRLLTQLLSKRFRAAALSSSQADIDVAAHAADLNVRYDAGPVYRFGPLDIEGLARYDRELVDRYNRHVRAGETYDEAAMADLQAALQGSGYFASVNLSTRVNEAFTGPDGKLRLPVHLTVRERKPHRISFGVGASSNTGARVEVNYNTLGFAGLSWKLNTGLRLEELKQTFYADVFLPPARANYLPSAGMAIERSDIENLKLDRRAFKIQRAHRRGSIDAELSLNWEQEDKRPQDGTPSSNRALVADGHWTWHRLDSILNPRSGQVLQVKLGVAAQAVLSDQDFVRSYGRYQLYIPVGERDSLTLRTELGYTAADSSAGIPEAYLFRAGGTNSVRGYAYNSLGVKNGDAIVGGRYLATASAEYTHWWGGPGGAWGTALFVDAGNAADDLKDVKPKYGAGAGVRWRSPAGPIAVDLAWGEDRKLPRLHFFLAIPF